MDRNNNDSSYAPESPDLSAAVPVQEVDPLPLQHQGYRGSISHSIPYPYPPSDHIPHPSSSPVQVQHRSPHEVASHYYPPPHQHLQHQPPLQPQIYHQDYHAQQFPYNPQHAMPPRRAPKKEESEEEWAPEPSYQSFNAGANNGVAVGSSSGGGLGFENIEVKTKFPVARIKRIMQADDDVGKVAQVTPVVVSKALELFMISLVTKAATEARSRNSKRVSALHLKQAVTKDEQFDFLVNIVSKVPDAPVASDKHDDDHPAEEKKKKASGRRKRKGSDED